MEQLEKVVKGLECCIMRDPDDELRCDICPYDGRCANRLKIDAIALINAQQERIKALEAELGQRDYNAAVEMQEYCERYEPTYNPEDGSM